MGWGQGPWGHVTCGGGGAGHGRAVAYRDSHSSHSSRRAPPILPRRGGGKYASLPLLSLSLTSRLYVAVGKASHGGNKKAGRVSEDRLA